MTHHQKAAIIREGHAIECIGNPAQKTQFKIFCEDPKHDDIMVGLPEDGRKFANWSDVINAATKQAQSRITQIEVFDEFVYERDQLEERSDFEKATLVILGLLILVGLWLIFSTIGSYVPVIYRG